MTTARKVECGNCDWTGDDSMDELGNQTAGGLIPLCDVEDFTERIDPGSEVPAGECPECGALAYLVEKDNQYHKPPRVLIIVSGGVADYVADPGVLVHIADYDDEGYLSDEEAETSADLSRDEIVETRCPPEFRDLLNRRLTG